MVAERLVRVATTHAARAHTDLLFQVVQCAVDVCDPDGADEGSIEMLRRFEDADEPVASWLSDVGVDV